MGFSAAVLLSLGGIVEEIKGAHSLPRTELQGMADVGQQQQVANCRNE